MRAWGNKSFASVVLAAAAVGGLTLTAAPAYAETQAATTQKNLVTSADPKQGCRNIGNGELCVHIWGNAGQNGRIAVSYHKFSGPAAYASVRWYNRSTGRGALLVKLQWMTAGNLYSGHFDTYLAAHRNVAVLEVFDPVTGRITQTFVSPEVRL